MTTRFLTDTGVLTGRSLRHITRSLDSPARRPSSSSPNGTVLKFRLRGAFNPLSRSKTASLTGPRWNWMSIQ